MTGQPSPRKCRSHRPKGQIVIEGGLRGAARSIARVAPPAPRNLSKMTMTGLSHRLRALALGASLGVLLSVTSSLALAQQQPQSNQRITPNFKDADIVQIAEAVGAATGKNFILDPRV